MKETNIERRLHALAEQETPDILDSVLRELGKEQPMELTATRNTVIPFPRAKSHAGKRILRQVASLAAAFALVVGAHAAYVNFSVDAVVGIDVNPSLELRVNRSEKVLSATALNDDAKVVMEGMDLKNVDLDVAVNAIIGSMLKNGYLGDADNAINVCVENDDAKRGEALSQKLTSEINDLLANNSVTGTVMTQIQEESTALAKLAEENSVSVGKVTLAQMAVSASGETLNFEDAVKMSVKELWAVIYPENTDFISLDDAKAIALKKAGLTAENTAFVSDRLYKKGTVYIYDLVLRSESIKCSVEIDALTGEVLDFESRQLTTSTTPTTSTTLIADTKAQEIAYADAGVKANQVTLKKCKLDEDDGIWVYDVEFKVDKDEYDYEIDAVSGKILQREIELYQAPVKTEPSKTETDKTDTPKLLAEAKALSLIYQDAGVKERNVTLIKCELGQDDGVWTYDVEFKVDKDEYDYEINAATGAILERDIDLYEDEVTDNTDDDVPPDTAQLIKSEKALRVSYQSAGVKSADAENVQCELDEDDGRWVYDVSFRIGQEEYDFEIDAVTGEVLSREIDIDEDDTDDRYDADNDDDLDDDEDDEDD